MSFVQNAIADGLAANFATCLSRESSLTILSLIQSKLGWKPDSSTIRHVNVEDKIKHSKVVSSPTKMLLPSEYASLQFHKLSADGVFQTLPISSILSSSTEPFTSLSYSESVLRLPLNCFTSNSNLKPMPPVPSNFRWAEVEGHFIQCGPEVIDIRQAHCRYVVTPTVRQYLKSLARVLSGGRVPILLEGPTSAGKSSLVRFLCQLTGHHFVRVNNHEHTDLQEYLGQHVTDQTTGQLVFVEGVMAQAARQGHWIVLDELNLASSEVLEGQTQSTSY